MNRRGFLGLVAGSVVAVASATRLGQVALSLAVKPAAFMALMTADGDELARFPLDGPHEFIDPEARYYRAIFPLMKRTGQVGAVAVFDADGGMIGHKAEAHGYKAEFQTWQVTVERKDFHA